MERLKFFRPRTLLHPYVLEFAALALIGLLYLLASVQPVPTTLPFTRLDPKPLERILFDPDMRQTGLEHERLAGVLLPVKIGLERYGRIPAWNPYIGTGEPLLNDAFNYLLNPFHSLPVILLGGVQGTKVAMFLALLIAAFSMWVFTKALGLGAVARVTAAALYMMSGGIIAKYFAGHFQLALSLSWPPLVFAGLWWTLRSQSRLAPVFTGLAFALLFFAGNIYYVLHTSLCAVLIVLVHLFERQNHGRKFNRQHLRRALLAGLFAVGLTALQLIPIWVTRGFVEHSNQEIRADGSLQGSYSLAQATNNLVIPWERWQQFENPETGMLVAVDYAYIGLAPFAVLVVALIAMLFQRLYFAGKPPPAIASVLGTRYLVLFLFFAFLMMVWGAGQTPVLEWLYAHLPLLAEFRYVGRAHAIAALWWIVLGAVALDWLWKVGQAHLPSPSRTVLLWALVIGFLVWLYLLIYSLTPVLTRLSLVLNNVYWVGSLDRLRFTTFPQAVSALWPLLLVAITLQLAIFLITRIFVALLRRRAPAWSSVGQRVLHTVLLAAAIVAIADILTSNSPLISFQPALPGFQPIYADIRAQDTAPFPAINEPWSPLTFETYQSGIRNWSLNEGWQPLSLPITSLVTAVPDTPRWAIVSNLYGSAGQGFAQSFVDRNDYTQRKCYALSIPAPADPCQGDNTHLTATLYEKPDALPYVFVASQDQLSNPASLTASSVLPATLITSELDTLVLDANTPENSEPYYLVIQESNFPGWRATVDQWSVEPVTLPTNTDTTKQRGFIALPMLPGNHTYRLYFETPGWSAGLLIFIITLIGIAAYFLLPLRKRTLR